MLPTLYENTTIYLHATGQLLKLFPCQTFFKTMIWIEHQPMANRIRNSNFCPCGVDNWMATIRIGGNRAFFRFKNVKPNGHFHGQNCSLPSSWTKCCHSSQRQNVCTDGQNWT